MHKKSLFSPNLQPTEYGLCLAISIVAGMAHSTNDINRYNYYLTYNGNYNELISEARSLCNNANVDLTHGGGVDEIIKFQQYLGYEYRIVVFASRDGNEILFKACHDDYKWILIYFSMKITTVQF